MSNAMDSEYKDDVPRVKDLIFFPLYPLGTHRDLLLCLCLALFLNNVDWLAAIFGGYHGAGLVHRIAAG